MKKVKRIASIVGIVFILSMYLVSFLAAIFSPKGAPGLFLASIFSTVVVPILMYLFIMIYKWVHKDDVPNIFEDTTDSAEKNHK